MQFQSCWWRGGGALLWTTQMMGLLLCMLYVFYLDHLFALTDMLLYAASTILRLRLLFSVQHRLHTEVPVPSIVFCKLTALPSEVLYVL
jgi:hypothetical protein